MAVALGNAAESARGEPSAGQGQQATDAGARPRDPLLNTGVIAARIAAASAGDTVEIGPGVYREHLRIDKAVRLVGVGEPRPVIDGAGSGDIVEIAAKGVELKGFVIRDTGIDLDKENCAVRVLASGAVIEDNQIEDILFGIDVKQASGVVIRNNRIGGKDLDIARRGDGIRLWRADRSVIEGNTIHDGRDAILWYSTGIIIRRNRAINCRYGFHLMYSDSVTIEENEVAGNSVGVYFMYSKDLVLRNNRILQNRGPSGYGLGLKETDRFHIEGNIFAANRVGLYTDGSPFTNSMPGEITGNTFAYNDVGVMFLPAVRGNQLTLNNFVDNIEQVAIQGRGELVGNDFSKDERGNFWSDYAGYDADHNGVGDSSYESQKLFENMMDKEPKLRLLVHSPAHRAIEFVARAIPAIQPEPKFSDDYPLMREVEIPGSAVADSAGPPARGGLARLSAVLCGAAGLVVFWALRPVVRVGERRSERGVVIGGTA